MSAPETLGDRLRRLRGKRSRAELGRKAGVSPSTIADIENQHRSKSEHAQALAQALGVGLEELLGAKAVDWSALDAWVPAAAWPFEELRPEEVRALDPIELSYVEQAALKALQKVRAERRRSKKAG